MSDESHRRGRPPADQSSRSATCPPCRGRSWRRSGFNVRVRFATFEDCEEARYSRHRALPLHPARRAPESVVEAPRAVSSEARPTRPECALSYALMPADVAAVVNRRPRPCAVNPPGTRGVETRRGRPLTD